MIEDSPVTILQVVEAVDDGGEDGALDDEPSGNSFLLEEVDCPLDRSPARFVRCPE